MGKVIKSADVLLAKRAVREDLEKYQAALEDIPMEPTVRSCKCSI